MISEIYLTDKRRHADAEPLNYERVNQSTGWYGYSSYFEEVAIAYGDLHYNAELDRYEMTQEAYDWWCRVVKAQTDIDICLADLNGRYDPVKVEGMLNGLDKWGGGIEDIPDLCEEIQELTAGLTRQEQKCKLTGESL